MTETELTTALTDLAAGLLLLPMIVCICRRNAADPRAKRWWIRFLVLLDGCMLIGFATHYNNARPLLYRVLWVPLFAVMFEVVTVFFLLALFLRSDGRRPRAKEMLYLHLLSLPFFGVCVYFETIRGIQAIKIYAVYAAVVSLTGIALLFRPAFTLKRRPIAWLLASLLPLLPAVYFQLDRRAQFTLFVEFNCDSISHFFIIASEILLFIAAKKNLPLRPDGTNPPESDDAPRQSS